MANRSKTLGALLAGTLCWATIVPCLAQTQPTTEPTTGPATAPALNPRQQAAEARKAVDAAIRALLEEFREFDKQQSAGDSKEPNAGVPRADSDYFRKNPPPYVAHDAILDSLTRRLDSNPRADAYVKWQLLSGLPYGRVEDSKMASRLLDAYQRAPSPTARPYRASQNQQLASALNGVTREQAQKIGLKIRTDVAAYIMYNEPIIKYRDELFKKLPQTLPAFEAGLRDYTERLQLGAPISPHLDEVVGSIRGWAIIAKRNELQQVAAMVQKLETVKGPDFYKSVTFDKDTGKPTWDRGNLNVMEMRELSALMKALQLQATGGPPGLRFRTQE